MTEEQITLLVDAHAVIHLLMVEVCRDMDHNVDLMLKAEGVRRELWQAVEDSK
jgi:hypothetical protein